MNIYVDLVDFFVDIVGICKTLVVLGKTLFKLPPSSSIEFAPEQNEFRVCKELNLLKITLFCSIMRLCTWFGKRFN